MNVGRGDLRDVYIEADRAAVFVEDQVMVLSEIATTILTSVPVSGTVALGAITQAVVERFGAPESPLSAQDLTRQHVLDLVAHGVLTDDTAVEDAQFTPESVAALRSALRHVVMAKSGSWQLPDGVTGAQFVAAAERHRVVPSLCAARATLSVPPTTAAALAAMTLQETATVQQLGAELAQIVSALESANVRVLAFKGLALAAQAHHDVSARGTGDHDLLVSPSDVERAHQVLSSNGWVPAVGFPRSGESWAWRRLVRDYYELSLEGRVSTIDLHWHLGPVRNAFPSFDVLWSRRVTVSISGRDVPTFSPYDALAHSATHTAKDHWRWLRGLLDVRLLTADPSVWDSADRPLRQDQLLSVGLAARTFGMPRGAPPVVHEALQLAAGSWDIAVERQSTASHVDTATRVPGTGLFRALIALRRAGGSASDVRRQLSLSLMPVTTTADMRASSPWVTVPRVLSCRAIEVFSLWQHAIRRRLHR